MLQRLADFGPDTLQGLSVFLLLSFAPGLAVLLALWRPRFRPPRDASPSRTERLADPRPAPRKSETRQPVRKPAAALAIRRRVDRAVAAR